MLWKFGIPAKIDRDGDNALVSTTKDEKQIKLAKKFDILANAGFLLITLGFILQLSCMFLGA